MCYCHGKDNQGSECATYGKAAAQNDEMAQYNLGTMYQQGFGMKQPDQEQAVKWFRKAAAQGHEKARAKLKGIQKNGGQAAQQD